MSFDLKPEAGDADDLPEDLAPAPEPLEPTEPSGPDQTVSLAKPLSRRAQAAKELNDKLEGLSKTVTTLSEGLSQRDQQLAQMRGFMEAQALRPQYAQYAQQPTEPDPAELFRKADEALDNRNYSEHKRLEREALTIIARREARGLVPQQQQQPANQMPPEMSAMFAAYPDVALHPDNIKVLQMKSSEMDIRRVPPGPERVRMVFAEADAYVKSLKKASGGAQYSQASASVLSGMPTSRSGGGGSGGANGPGISLNAAEQKIAADLERKGIMSKSDYAKGLAEADPSRVSQ